MNYLKLNPFKQPLAALLLLFLFLFFSCSKERIEETKLNEYASSEEYFNSKMQQEQEYIIDTNGTCPLTALQGTELCVEKKCLSLPNGDSVYFPYILKVIEIYSPKDMIYAQISNVSEGKIIESAGVIKVTAFKNGAALQLRSGCSYSAKMPHATPKNNKRLYTGMETPLYINWVDVYSSVFTNTGNGHFNTIPAWGWINCASDVSSGDSRKIAFTSKTDNLDNVAIFIYIPSKNVLTRVYNAESELIPNGVTIKIIAIGIKEDGSVYTFYQEKQINYADDIIIKMEASSEAKLESLLNGL